VADKAPKFSLLKVFGIAAVAYLAFSFAVGTATNKFNKAASNEMNYSDFVGKAKGGKMTAITIQTEPDGRTNLLRESTALTNSSRSNGNGQNIDPSASFTHTTLSEREIRNDLEPFDKIKVIPTEPAGIMSSLLFSLIPIAVLVGALIYLSRKAGGGAGGPGGIGKSKHKVIIKDKNQKTFADVAGIEEAKEEVSEVVDFLKDPQKYTAIGGRIPKGVLLVGPPGTGKTLLAKAVAGEASVPFFSLSGSDFVEMFVGVGASRVRDMFEQAKKDAPCIVFIDEIDAIGRKRGGGIGGAGNEEREQTLNALLVEMDGFGTDTGIILMAATNRPDVLDPALLRPGRFDRQVTVSQPDVKGREAILKVHSHNIRLAEDIDLKVVAQGTPGFSGADLENLVNEAALHTARNNRINVTAHDFDEAKDKIMMGAARPSIIMSPKDKLRIARHEAGHALVALKTEGADPVHKVSIIPRGRALGVTVSLPSEDIYNYNEKRLRATLAMLYGGRVAEEIAYGKDDTSTGASNDIERASSMARSMVTEWGMSEKVGPIRTVSEQQNMFLGGGGGPQQNVSGDTAKIIDEEVKRIVTETKGQAEKILKENDEIFQAIVDALMEHETIDATDIATIMAGDKVVRNKETKPPMLLPPQKMIGPQQPQPPIN